MPTRSTLKVVEGPVMRRFKVTKTVTVELSIDRRVLDDVLTDEWRSSFYRLHKPEDVAEHLAFNFMQGRPLHTLDGFADQPDERGRLHDVSWDEGPGSDRGGVDVEEVSVRGRKLS